MSLVISYKTLFEVNILHHFFLDKGNENYDSLSRADQEKFMSFYSVASFLKIKPTEACTRILRNHHCVFRNNPKGFKVWVKVKMDEDGHEMPFMEPADDLKFTFNLLLADQNFYNYTALPLLDKAEKIFFFTNLAKTEALITREYPYLSNYAPVFGNKIKYSAGDMIVDDNTAPSKLFVAKGMTITDPAISTTDWHQETNSPLTGKPYQYVNEYDLVKVTTAFLKHTKTEGNAVLFGQVEINYRSDDPSFNLTNEEGYLLKKDGKLAPPVFVLRFKNRSTTWRYLGKDLSNAPETADPQPLTKFGSIHISLNNDKGDTLEGLPNPTVNMIKVEPDEDKTAYNIYSETYIN